MTTPDDKSDAEAEVRAAARDLDRDRYLAALLAPPRARAGLMLIAAFHGEIARIPASVREAAMGEIRLQWWRDALAAPSSAEDVTGAPLADAARRAIVQQHLDARELLAIIDAYGELLLKGSLADADAVAAFADASQGAAFRLAAAALGAGGADAGPLLAAAAQAYGRVQLVRALPALLARGRNPFPEQPALSWEAQMKPLLFAARTSLAEVRRLMPLAAATMRAAILPVALVEPYLAALEKLGPDVASQPATISPLTRVWRLYTANRRGRF
jgi:phytoene synthase